MARHKMQRKRTHCVCFARSTFRRMYHDGRITNFQFVRRDRRRKILPPPSTAASPSPLSLFLSLSFLFSLVSTFCTGQDMHCSQIFVCNSIYAAERKRIAFRNAFETRRKPEYKAHWRYRARYHDEWRERPVRTICDVNSDSLALGRFYILRY